MTPDQIVDEYRYAKTSDTPGGRWEAQKRTTRGWISLGFVSSPLGCELLINDDKQAAASRRATQWTYLK